jgi:hypothetical protein
MSSKLVGWMLTSGRRSGGKPGTGLSGRSVALSPGRLTAALESGQAEGKIVSAAGVDYIDAAVAVLSGEGHVGKV